MSDHRALRRAQVAALARDSGLDGVLVRSWHRQSVPWLTGYAPGYVTNQAALWVGADGECRLGVRFPFDLDRAAAAGLPTAPVAHAAELLPDDVRRVGVVAGDAAVDETTPELLARLHDRGIEPVDLREAFDDLQEVKLPEEVDGLRRAGELGARALEAWGDLAPTGVSDFEVAARVEGVCRQGGARRAYCLVGVGPGAAVTEATGRRIGAEDSVGLELTMYVDEWCMHVNRQLDPAHPDPSVVTARTVSATARARILDALVPGRAVDDVVAVGDRVLGEAGLLAAKEYDFGHGVAADTPAHPRMVGGTGRRLAAGSVLALHVAVRVPQGATAFVGGPVVVGETGARELVPDSSWARETTLGRQVG